MTAAAGWSAPALDHLVVLADTLAQGAAWCEQTLGVAPGPGGQHPLFGTHNRLLCTASAEFPLSYLEIIAIDPGAVRAHADSGGGQNTVQKRWFDMDDPALRERVRAQGPQLIHWVARVPDIDSAVGRLATLDIDRGDVRAASRMTPRGLLEWKIAVRPDGQRLFDGALPTLIEWGAVHPAASMHQVGVSLQGLRLSHPRAAALRQACAAVGLGALPVDEGPAALHAKLRTPRGVVSLSSDEGAR